jgi:gliding motility-associated-like protein
MMKGSDAFERSLREALESYEVPYNSADWAQLERQLDQEKKMGPWRSGSAGMYALMLGGALAVATTAHLWYAGHDLPAGGATITIHDEAPATRPDVPVVQKDADDLVAEHVSTERTIPSGRSANTGPKGPASGKTPVADGPEPVAEAPKTSVSIKASVSEGCPGARVDFAAENMPENGIHLWNFGDGSFSNKPDPSHTFTKPGTYKVMLSYPSMGGGNFASEPASDRIVIHDVPEAGFDHQLHIHENAVPTVHFENRSTGGRTFLWEFGDGTVSTEAHPDHVFKQKGDHTVTLTVFNAKGCVDRTERVVTVPFDYNLLAAKTFSPNGDGVEDVFIPEALRTLGVRFQFSVFDPRTGRSVFETTDPKRAWNGRIDNKGEPCAPGDYVWMVEMKDGERFGGSYNGTVTLVR